MIEKEPCGRCDANYYTWVLAAGCSCCTDTPSEQLELEINRLRGEIENMIKGGDDVREVWRALVEWHDAPTWRKVWRWVRRTRPPIAYRQYL